MSYVVVLPQVDMSAEDVQRIAYVCLRGGRGCVRVGVWMFISYDGKHSMQSHTRIFEVGSYAFVSHRL